MGDSQSKIKCSCCEYRHSRTQYKKRGELCNQCNKYYTEHQRSADEIENNHIPESGEPLGEPPKSSKKCDCCELFYDSDDVIPIIFECRKDGHILYFCINCGTKRLAADSVLICPFRRSDTNDRRCGQQSTSNSNKNVTKKNGKVSKPIGKED